MKFTRESQSPAKKSVKEVPAKNGAEEVKDQKEPLKKRDSKLIGKKKSKTLRAVAQDQMKKMHEEKGHQPSNQENIYKVNKSKTIRAAHELIVKYLCDENGEIMDNVYNSKMYLKPEQVKKKSIELHKVPAINSPTYIDNEGHYRLYFNSPDGAKRKWKVIHDYPKFTAINTILYVRIWFPSLNHIMKLDVLKIAPFADDFEMIAYLSLLQLYFKELKDLT